jgi:Helix-hairpin-helix motif
MKGTQRWAGVLLTFATFGIGLVAVATYAAGQQSSGAGGKVDLNSASEKDLETLPGVGAATAKKIIAGRPYSSVTDLSKAGVSAATIDKITPLVTVGNAPTSGSSSTRTRPASNSPPSSQPSPESGTSPAAPPSSAKSATPAPGSGMVWVNTDTGIYHREGSRYYGKTKNGKYMSVADAEKAGYKAAKNE